MFFFLLFFFLCFFLKKNQFYYIHDFMSLISLYRIICYIHTYIYYFAIAICYNILTNLTYIQSYIHLYNTYAIVTIALNLIFSARVTSFFVVEDLNHICLFVKHHNLYKRIYRALPSSFHLYFLRSSSM